MASLHGKTLTAKEYSALQKKWKAEDKKFWTKQHKEAITRQKAHISKLRKLAKSALTTRLIASNVSKLKQMQAKKI